MHDSIQTPKQMIEVLVAGLPDTIPGNAMLTAETAGRTLLAGASEELRADLRAYGTLERSLTPRDQARAILQNMTMRQDERWTGYEAITDLVRLYRGDIQISDLSGDRLAATCAFGLAVTVHAQSIAPLVAVVQPADRPCQQDDGRQQVSAFHRAFEEEVCGEGENAFRRLRINLQRSWLPLEQFSLSARTSAEEMDQNLAYHGLDSRAELLAALGREMAIEQNLGILSLLLATAPNAEDGGSLAAKHLLFRNSYGVPTARFLGSKAARVLLGDQPRTLSEPFAGLTRVADMSVDTFVVHAWEAENADTCLLVRAKPEELLAPLAYAPLRWTAGLGEVGEGEAKALRQEIRLYAGLQVVESRLLARVDLK